MKRRTGRRTGKRKARPRPVSVLEDRAPLPGLGEEVARHPETGPALTAGDLDADWRRAHDSGDEAVGGSVATPDQDVVDEIGRALGVPQDPDAPVRSSEEILHDRTRFRWHLERDAADADEGRTPRRPSAP